MILLISDKKNRKCKDMLFFLQIIRIINQSNFPLSQIVTFSRVSKKIEEKPFDIFDRKLPDVERIW